MNKYTVAMSGILDNLKNMNADITIRNNTIWLSDNDMKGFANLDYFARAFDLLNKLAKTNKIPFMVAYDYDD